MAFERIRERQIISTNLNAFIGTTLVLMQNQRARRNAQDETRFLNAVLEDNLSIDDQIEYRRSQLKRVAKNDSEERMRISRELANLKDLQEVQSFNDAYLSELMQFNSGAQSIDGTISWLTDRLSRTTDSNIQNKIKEQLNTLKGQQYTMRKTVIERQTQYANEDKSEQVINSQIDNVSRERKTALISGNDDYVSVLDLQLQSLKKTLSESRIQKIATDMSASTLTGQSSLSLLNHFNQMVESSSVDTPITVGGVRYDSEQDFWSSKRSEYLNDRSGNGFFDRYSSELKDQVDYKQSRNVLKNKDITDVNSWYEGLKDRPELLGYQERINQEQTKGLKYAADLKANEAINQFATDLDAVKAVNTISYLQENFGVNMTGAYQKVIQMASQEKESQVQQILSTMGAIMKDNPGMSQEQALKQSVQSGAGVVFSPQELATSKASDIITDAGTKAATQQFGENGASGITIPEAKSNVFEPGADFQEGGLYKAPDSSSVYKYENGQLRAFEGNWTGESFTQATGKTFKDVQTIQSIGGATKGTPIRTTDFKLNDTEASKQVKTQQQTAVQPQPTTKPNIVQYTIQKGDNLSTIAARNNLKIDDILRENKDTVKDPNKIKAGQVLKLPKL